MTVQNALLKIALRDESADQVEVTNTFIALTKRADITKTINTLQDSSDWSIADFFLNNVRFSAAYNDLLGEVKILSLKFEGTGVINLFNASQAEVDGFFLAWAGNL